MTILLDAFSLTPAAAVAYLRKKQLRISGSWTQLWKEQHTRSFTVANLLKLDLLQEIRNQVNNAVNGELAPDSTGQMVKRGISFQEFKKRLVPKLKSRGWWGITETVNPETGEIIERKLGSVSRLRTIYNTNVQTAYMAGRYKGQREVIKDLPYWQYKIGYAAQHTERCSALDGQSFPADDPIWDTIYPPNHFGCTGSVRALSKQMADRDNVVVQSSEGNTVSKQELVGTGDDTRTVTVNGVRITDKFGEQHTFYPDPGWDYNPGKSSFNPDLKKYDRDIAALYRSHPSSTSHTPPSPEAK